jgi:hypothetical protein
MKMEDKEFAGDGGGWKCIIRPELLHLFKPYIGLGPIIHLRGRGRHVDIPSFCGI